jgi:hypothetical protein
MIIMLVNNKQLKEGVCVVCWKVIHLDNEESQTWPRRQLDGFWKRVYELPVYTWDC